MMFMAVDVGCSSSCVRPRGPPLFILASRNLALTGECRSETEILTQALTNLNLRLSSYTIIIVKKATTRHHGMLKVFFHTVSDDVHQPLAIDLLNPSAEHEKRQHKLKRLVQSPNSYFMDVKCPGLFPSLSFAI